MEATKKAVEIEKASQGGCVKGIAVRIWVWVWVSVWVYVWVDVWVDRYRGRRVVYVVWLCAKSGSDARLP